jgi:hypothetical protein
MSTVVEAAHAVAIEQPLETIASELQDVLGQRVVAYAIGDRHPKTVGRYARGERTNIDYLTEQRLIDTYTALHVLLQQLKPRTARSWMLGSNPALNGISPIELIHDGRAGEVIGAAEAFVVGR